MLRLYRESGSQEITLASDPVAAWDRLRGVVLKSLRTGGANEAADVLEALRFDLYPARNGFGDHFHVLYLKVSPHRFTQLAEETNDHQKRDRYRQIAATVTDHLGLHIRFVVADLDTDTGSIDPVTPPALQITSDAVERALRDAERLIANHGGVSGVDRVHTAFHGYLKAVVATTDIEVADDASITVLFKSIRKQHPRFQAPGARGADMQRVEQAMATIVDALNPVRNQATLAHPNEVVLDEPEAMLAINAVRTLLHYLDTKLR